MSTGTTALQIPPMLAAAPAVLPASGFVREAKLLAFIPFSHSTLWRRVAAQTFPAPIKLSERVTVWRVQDVRDWIDRQQ